MVNYIASSGQSTSSTGSDAAFALDSSMTLGKRLKTVSLIAFIVSVIAILCISIAIALTYIKKRKTGGAHSASAEFGSNTDDPNGSGTGANANPSSPHEPMLGDKKIIDRIQEDLTITGILCVALVAYLTGYSWTLSKKHVTQCNRQAATVTSSSTQQRPTTTL